MNMTNWMRKVSNQTRRRTFRKTERRLQLQPLEVRELLAVDAFEPNGSFAAASNLGSSSATYSVTIEPIGDVDYYRWQAPGNGVVRFDALFSQSQGDLDMRLYDANFNEIDASVSLDDDERVRASVTSSQTVYVKVSEFSGMRLVPYTLKVTFIQPDSIDASFNNNSIATPYDLGTGDRSLTNLNIHNSSDVDYFRWTANTSGVLNVNVNSFFADGDLTLTVLTPGGTEIISSATSNDNERVSLNVSAGTQYIVKVNEAQGLEHPRYDLQLGFGAPPTISDIPLTLGTMGGVTLINFQVNDADSPLSSLVVTGTSSNQFLVPNSNITFTGTGANRTAAISSPAGFGFVTMTFTVTDPTGNSATDTFDLGLFLSGGGAPVISSIGNVSIVENGSSGIINFTVNDSQTPASQLVVTAASSNTTLIPNNNLFLGGSDGNRTLRITPAPNQTGSSVITVTVRDTDNATATTTFVANVFAAANMPTISPINDVTINEDTSTGPIPFTVSDADTPLSLLSFTVGSSNAALVPTSNVVIAGSGASRTVTVTPVANVSGLTTISLTVSDGSATFTETFNVNVTSINDLPTISFIPDVTIAENSSMAPTPFTVGDAETDPNNLTITVASNNTFVVPVDRITIGGTGANRTVSVTPLPDRQGQVVITLTVNDGNGGATARSFTLHVSGDDDPPTISMIPDQSIALGATSTVAFTVTDDIKPASELFVTAFSSDQSIVDDDDLLIIGTGENRLVSIKPLKAGGPVTISLVASDGALNSTRQFNVIVVSTGPAITNIPDQIIDEDGSTGPLPFTVGDPDTPAASLTVTAISSNPMLIPNSSIILAGTGASRTVNVIPVANASGGPIAVTLTVSDGTSSASETFNVTVRSVDDAPIISSVADQTIDQNSATGPLQFTIADIDTAVDSLIVTGTSSNQALVPNSQIILGGSGANRTVNVIPASNASGGPATITLTVSDGTSSTTTTFNVTVTGVNAPPSISSIPSQTIDENTSTGPVAFTVADPDTSANALIVTATSNNQALIPDGNIVLGGTGPNRTVTATPVANASGGPAVITVTVSDGTTSVATSFSVTVTDVIPDRVMGDSNNDGFFDSSDLVHVFAAGEYEDNIAGNSTWEEGDWNGDGDFNSTDLVDAFAAGTYETGAPAAPKALLNGNGETPSGDSSLSASKLADLALADSDIVSGDDLLGRWIKKGRS